MYTDDSILPRGKFKFRRLKDVPIKYLEGLAKSKGGGFDPELIKYIAENIDRIREGFPKLVPVIPLVPFICEKKTYPTQADAKRALAKIRTDEGEHKKPIRTYECEKCSGWHLTSKPIEEYKKLILTHAK